MASAIIFVGDEYIPFLSSLLPRNLKQDLEENLLDNNTKREDCECDSIYIKHRSESVRDVVRWISRSHESNKRKTCACWEEEGGKLTTTQQHITITNFPQIYL